MDTGIIILRLLSEFCYLTCSQMMSLGIKVSSRSLYRRLGELRGAEHTLIGTKKFPVHPKYGTFEDIHYLTPKGRKYLIHSRKVREENIKIPIGSYNFFQDYYHRKKCIDIKIKLVNSFKKKGAGNIIYDSYFEGRKKRSGKGRESSTNIFVDDSYIRPDSILKYSVEGKEGLICVELHMGNDVVRIGHQLRQHAKAIAMGAPSIKYDLTTSNRVLTIFENQSCKYSTIERLLEDEYFCYMKDHFLFSDLDDLLIDGAINVLNLGNEEIQLLT